ncbi:hypothetical protein [Telmatospirillum sp.]|uniref:hypothetical protein n=1 Tax=Telmatospirillum sp. TaxID=2079197 RepID=UPI00284C4AB2|nr:hypothetical protein [Telmatospirillum sp.]MDR3436404.1 hypothetical protein [Telmatospirillum sp.]
MTAHVLIFDVKHPLGKLAYDLGLHINAEFVPYSQSRSFKANHTFHDYNLNWKVSLTKDTRPIISCDYSAGMGHCPSYKYIERLTNDYVSVIKAECELGVRHRRCPLAPDRKHPILPDANGVLNSLVMDADVLDYSTFEAWALELDFDPDSRKAEAIYRECLIHALSLRNGVRDENLQRLKTAAQDF